ncbi:MAG: CDP-alcohol phosphatidyltransferase family protein [Hyphomicrobiaceae bacterium]|nr:CDP-alcohol phosphatidyltransferase family protein [Hyphomicrobiaceae bacterium]
MFDARIRPLIDPAMNAAGRWLAARGATANAVTVAGFAVGMAGAGAIVIGQLTLALVLILASRIADGLDGAVARATQKSDFGGFLDIALDFVFYGAVPLAFAILAPEANALAAAMLLMSYFANGTAFLAFAIMAERRGLETTAQGQKSLYYMLGMAEGAETIAVSALFCVLPAHFATIAYIYAAVCFASATGRILYARRVLS